MAQSTTTTWDMLKATLDNILGRLYNYHGATQKPETGTEPVWTAPSNLPEGTTSPQEYFLHYFQSQSSVPTKNECVTTAAVMGMNIMKDRAASGNLGPVQFISNLSLKEYTSNLDKRGILGWKYRIQTGIPIFEGMMTPWQAVLALRDHAKKTKKDHGRSYKARLSPRCTVNDLINNLKQGNIMLIHGAWGIKLATAIKDRHLPFIGGMPHTMLLVGYDPGTDHWLILDPARNLPPTIRHMKTEELIKDFWGRKFLFYPPRFSVTVIYPDQ